METPVTTWNPAHNTWMFDHLNIVDPHPVLDIRSDEDALALAQKTYLAVPFTDAIHPRLMDMLVSWKMAGMETTTFQNSGGFLEIVRMSIVHEFLQSGREFLVFIDADTVPDAVEAPFQLVAHNAPVVAGWAAVTHPVYGITTNFACGKFPVRADAQQALPTQGLVAVDWVGCGLMALRRDVFGLVDDAFFIDPEDRRKAAKAGTIDVTEDQAFCIKARDAGLQLLVDLSVTATHFKLQGLRYPKDLLHAN